MDTKSQQVQEIGEKPLESKREKYLKGGKQVICKHISIVF